MEDVKVLALTISPKTIMNSSPHFAIMAGGYNPLAQLDQQGF